MYVGIKNNMHWLSTTAASIFRPVLCVFLAVGYFVSRERAWKSRTIPTTILALKCTVRCAYHVNNTGFKVVVANVCV
jgi:hypothetical protein